MPSLFSGILMGIAIRTGSPLSLNLAEPVWKQLVGLPLTPADLNEVDRDYVPGLMCIRDMEPEAFQKLDMPFATHSATGQEVRLSAKYQKATVENRAEYRCARAPGSPKARARPCPGPARARRKARLKPEI
ncbi:hypothetical protein HPB50_024084 [Hyalomma asiaticum]|uniref:Uncharacterized protein n=1 Tax=Hyalomma asiaticum TaxID=266040 RepID=A0ACB7SSK0_HYAAI|nr:hypothetical protein HPB50_024084 [Hyalomma asiaticum]